MTGLLTGKSALVTGGGTGVGAAVAHALAAAGAEVVIAGRTESSLQETAAAHSGISPVVADVSDEKSIAGLFASLTEVDIVVANAGASESGPFAKTELATWNRMLAVNLTGVFLTFREGLRHMPRGGGRLIAIASTAGLKGYAYAAAYAAAKHGVVGLVRSLALEVAKSGITVNAVCPGFIDTEMTDRSVANIVEKTGCTADEARMRLAGFNPQGRLVKPEEVANTVLWLCGEGAAAVNGETISVSGGEV